MDVLCQGELKVHSDSSFSVMAMLCIKRQSHYEFAFRINERATRELRPQKHRLDSAGTSWN